MPNWSSDDIARIIISVGQKMGITPRGIVIGLAVGLVESDLTVYANPKVPGSLDLPHDAVGSDGFSVGVQQQQVVNSGNGWWWGPVEQCQDPTSSAQLFFTRLARLDYNSDANTPGSYAQAVQQSAFGDRYDQRMSDAVALYNQIAGESPVTTPAVPCDTSYNEYPRWTKNLQNRGGTKPDLFLLHTEEGAGNADGLASFLISTEGTANAVSYHYTISEASDLGVTVCDVVDTDYASWSVMNSNNRSINLCFAGSYASWSREQWLQQANAIDVAAFLAVQDCVKYGITPKVIPGPGYNSDPPGISDHRYCTDYLKDGNTHTDVGNNFPWDVFTAAVEKYSATQPAPSPAIRPVQTADEYTAEIFDQLRARWNCLGGQTIVEALAEVRDKTLGTSDRNTPGIKEFS